MKTHLRFNVEPIKFSAGQAVKAECDESVPNAEPVFSCVIGDDMELPKSSLLICSRCLRSVLKRFAEMAEKPVVERIYFYAIATKRGTDDIQEWSDKA